MLADGFTTRRGRRGALIHHDGVNHMLRPRRGARLTAITSGGAIPDNADYQVLLDPENIFIGTVNEDFAVESMAGDVFQLGNHSYRIIRVEKSAVRVEDAHGQAPTIPFWLGEAPGRSNELSYSVSRFRAQMAESFKQDPSGDCMLPALSDRMGLSDAAARELVDYLARGLRRARHASDPRHDRLRALLRRSGRHAARHPFALSAAASTAPGASRCASASAASSTSSFRRRRPKTTSYSRSRPRTVSISPKSHAIFIPRPSSRC